MVEITSANGREGMTALESSSFASHPLVSAIRPHLDGSAPILCHLNADTSWLVLIPHPTDARSETGRKFFNLLIDPWFAGLQVDYFVWFSVQQHAIPSSVQTISELEGVLNELERIQSCTVHPEKEEPTGSRASSIDAVIVSHEFTDHCHRATLTQLPPSTPVIAGAAAAKLIKSWSHFDVEKVHIMLAFTSLFATLESSQSASKSKFGRSSSTASTTLSSGLDWRLAKYDALPHWLSVSRLLTPRDLPQPGFHAGVMIAFPQTVNGEGKALIYSPHGLTPTAVLPVIASGSSNSAKDEAVTIPPLMTLALLHGIVKIDLVHGLMPLNFGGGQGEKVARALSTRYWLGTHEEDKVAGGGIARLLRRRTITPNADSKDKERNDVAVARFRELGSGEVLALE